MSGHRLITPEECKKNPGGYHAQRVCPICDGGLGVCAICGAAEAELSGPCKKAPCNPVAKSKVVPESITAAGNACIGLGNAINGLAKNGMTAQALELTNELRMISKSLSWLIREDRDEIIDRRKGKDRS